MQDANYDHMWRAEFENYLLINNLDPKVPVYQDPIFDLLRIIFHCFFPTQNYMKCFKDYDLQHYESF